eukprot:UN12540
MISYALGMVFANMMKQITWPNVFVSMAGMAKHSYLDYDSPTHIELKHNDGKYIVFLIVIVSFMTILALIITYLLVGIYNSKFGADEVNTYIDEDLDVSINNNARRQRDKQLKSSHLAQLTF